MRSTPILDILDLASEGTGFSDGKALLAEITRQDEGGAPGVYSRLKIARGELKLSPRALTRLYQVLGHIPDGLAEEIGVQYKSRNAWLTMIHALSGMIATEREDPVVVIADAMTGLGFPVPRQHVRYWFIGKTHPKPDALAYLAYALGISRDMIAPHAPPGDSFDPDQRKPDSLADLPDLTIRDGDARPKMTKGDLRAARAGSFDERVRTALVHRKVLDGVDADTDQVIRAIRYLMSPIFKVEVDSDGRLLPMPPEDAELLSKRCGMEAGWLSGASGES